MSEPTRQDLKIPCTNPNCQWGDVPTEDGFLDQCPECSASLHRPLTDAEYDRIAKDMGYIEIDGPDYEELVHQSYEAGYDRGYDNGYDDGFRTGREDEASYHM